MPTFHPYTPNPLYDDRPLSLREAVGTAHLTSRSTRDTRLHEDAPSVVRISAPVTTCTGRADPSRAPAVKQRNAPKVKVIRAPRKRFRNNPNNVGRLAR